MSNAAKTKSARTRRSMTWSSFRYLTGQGLRAMKKNRLMSVASIGVLAVCLLITGVAGLFSINVNSLMAYLGGQNEVVVYLQENMSDESLAQTDTALRGISGLREVEYISQVDALEKMKESMGEYADLWNDFEGEENPFLANYRIVLDDIGELPEILPKLQALPGVNNVQAPVQLGETFTSVQNGVNVICLVLICVLAFVSIVVISNTIRLTVYNRRNEISIMKYVGATNGFIRFPFFVEGITVGLAAGTIAAVVVLGGYAILLHYIAGATGFWGVLLSASILPVSQVWYIFLLAFWLFGSLIGSIGTATSVRKYLKV